MSGATWRADAHLRSGKTHDGLRAELRAAIDRRNVADFAAHRARDELDRMRAMATEARLALARFAPLDSERAAARIAAVRAGRPADDSAFAARVAERDEAATHVADVDRAVAQVGAEVAEAERRATDAATEVEALAAAIVALQIERMADRLEALEKEALALRTVTKAVAGIYLDGFAAGGPTALPVTWRTKSLLGSPPVNAHIPGFPARDDRTKEAFRAHARDLLKDADAPLATHWAQAS